MICVKCHRSFDRPLELYDGEWVCPKCHKTIDPSADKLVLSAESEELFRLSEVCYLRAIKSKDEAVYGRELQTAIALCKKAAQLSHPKALMRLGFYYESGYTALEGDEAFRMACIYYKSLWNCEKFVNETDKNYKNDDIKQLRSLAAGRHLKMLRHVPSRFEGHEAYNHAAVKAQTERLGLSSGGGEDVEQKREQDHVSRILSLFESFKSSERAPLMGVIRLCEEDRERLFAAKDPTGKSRVIRTALGGTALTLFSEGFPSSGGRGKYRTLKSERDLLFDEDEREDYAVSYLYFFNRKGSHDLSGMKTEQVRRRMEKNGHDFVTQIILKSEDARRDFVFYDDDVLRYKETAIEPCWHAVQDMINAFKEKENQ